MKIFTKKEKNPDFKTETEIIREEKEKLDNDFTMMDVAMKSLGEPVWMS